MATANWQDLPEVYAWLAQFINFEKNTDQVKFTLDNIRILTNFFNHPENSNRKIHVAGSKGKGSTSILIANIIQATGHKVGIYSSPHVQYFSERFTTPDGPFAPEIYQSAFIELKAGVEELIATQQINPKTITWYDLTTILGMLVFRQAKVDFAIYEVGMGGRLDSTNIIIPEASVITPIELEHTVVLGKTHAKIAREKAGIIKPNVPVFVSRQVPSAKKVIQEIAAQNHAKFIYLPDVCHISKINYTVSQQKLWMNYNLKLQNTDYHLTSQLVGKVQAENAALATLVARQIVDPSPKQITSGIKHAFLPGRFEFIIGKDIGYPNIPYIVIDGAHTKASVTASMTLLRQLPEARSALILFGAAKGKNIDAMATTISKDHQDIIITKPGDFKESDPDDIWSVFKQKNIDAEVIPNFAQAIPEAIQRAHTARQPLVIIGSLHLAGEIKKALSAIDH